VVLRVDLNDAEKRKFLNLPGLEIRHLGCQASRYTECAIPASHTHSVFDKKLIEFFKLEFLK
jgi:hypothetical protein